MSYKPPTVTETTTWTIRCKPCHLTLQFYRRDKLDRFLASHQRHCRGNDQAEVDGLRRVAALAADELTAYMEEHGWAPVGIREGEYVRFARKYRSSILIPLQPDAADYETLMSAARNALARNE